MSISSLVSEKLKIWGSKCHQNKLPVVCDGYVKYEKAEIDRLVAILKTNNCGSGGPDRVEYSKQPTSARAA